LVTCETPQPQAEIVNRYGCGIVVDSFEPKRIAAQLQRLTAEQIREFKQKADVAARELTAQKNMEKLGEIVNHLVMTS
jgi:UDP:flavonoid glycosyltransferase YjiC (YdhE family)